LEDEEIITPRETNIARETRKDYFREPRSFLEFAGQLNPRLVHHRTGNMPSGMAEMQKRLVDDAMMGLEGSCQSPVSFQFPLESQFDEFGDFNPSVYRFDFCSLPDLGIYLYGSGFPLFKMDSLPI